MRARACRPVVAWVGAVALTIVSASSAAAEETVSPRVPRAAYVGYGETIRSAGRCHKAPATSDCCRDRLIRDPLLCLPGVDPAIKRLQTKRDRQPLRIALGAYHWVNHNLRNGSTTYGFPGGFEGTYYYYAKFDVGGPVCWGPIRAAGVHVEVQWRDQTKFRRFYKALTWLYETYGWVELGRLGTLKVGQVWRRFGLDTEGTFWGHVPYYNGHTFDPDLMASWEHTWQGRKGFTVDTYAQALLGEDGINGSIQGGDAESSSIYDEGLGVNLRVVPTWTTETTTVAVGASLLAQQIEIRGEDDDTNVAAAIDASVRWCGLEVFGAAYSVWGPVNEAHYVTGGPSDRKLLSTVGVAWTLGSLTPRVSYSHGAYEHPGGTERIWIAGFDLDLTSWLILTVEYVNQSASGSGVLDGTLEEGLQFVLNWNL